MDWASRVEKFVSIDYETHLIEPGRLAPRIVCGSTANVDGGRLLDRAAALAHTRALLESDAIIVGANIVFDFGCAAVADSSLLPLIFKAYAEERVYDIQIAQALDAIAHGLLYVDPVTRAPMRGRYSLDTCVKYVLGRDDAKANDYWRLRYALLEDIPIAEWPEEARQYPIDDACNTLEVAFTQVLGGGEGPVPGPLRNLGDLSAQAETMWALHLGAMWGLRTDPERVAELRAKTEKSHAAFVEKFQKLGFFKTDGKKDNDAIKRAVILAYGGGGKCAECTGGRVLSEKTGNPIKCKACSGTGVDPGPVPRTPAGGVSADRDTLMESGDEHLMQLGSNEAEKVLETYLPWLETAVEKPMTLRPNVLVASGRTSYDGLIQLVPRDGGVRETIRARGKWCGSPVEYVLCSADYAAGELCTVSQICYWLFGRSQMMETINATGDPGGLHTAFAATLTGRTTEEMTVLVKAGDASASAIRTLAKFCNFALWGGMGAAKFCLLARKKSSGKTIAPDSHEYHGIRFCILIGGKERCGERRVTEFKNHSIPPICADCLRIADEILRPSWFKQWPEAPRYLHWVSDRVESGGEFPCFGTERVRGGLNFTNGANNGFQALLADAAKYALRKVTRECYLDDSSPLFGTRPVFFAHDEIVAEMPLEVAHLAGPRMAEIMVTAARHYVPDVCIVAEPALMRFWSKGVKTVYDDSGKLVVWEKAA